LTPKTTRKLFKVLLTPQKPLIFAGKLQDKDIDATKIILYNYKALSHQKVIATPNVNLRKSPI